jgi:hypothetical protein
VKPLLKALFSAGIAASVLAGCSGGASPTSTFVPAAQLHRLDSVGEGPAAAPSRLHSLDSVGEGPAAAPSRLHSLDSVGEGPATARSRLHALDSVGEGPATIHGGDSLGGTL